MRNAEIVARNAISSAADRSSSADRAAKKLNPARLRRLWRQAGSQPRVLKVRDEIQRRALKAKAADDGAVVVAATDLRLVTATLQQIAQRLHNPSNHKLKRWSKQTYQRP